MSEIEGPPMTQESPPGYPYLPRVAERDLRIADEGVLDNIVRHETDDSVSLRLATGGVPKGFVPRGTYTTETVDFGEVANVAIRVETDTEEVQARKPRKGAGPGRGAFSVAVEISTGDSVDEMSDWTDIGVGHFTLRCFKLRLVFATKNKNLSHAVNRAVLRVATR